MFYLYHSSSQLLTIHVLTKLGNSTKSVLGMVTLVTSEDRRLGLGFNYQNTYIKKVLFEQFSFVKYIFSCSLFGLLTSLQNQSSPTSSVPPSTHISLTQVEWGREKRAPHG
uniref:Uncharacterized protein n=1 Tax=Cacopsylla melanoneura TaxID=428564 RepID=A0A8D8R880_9HEMI